MHYDLTADQLAEHLHRFVTEHGVRAIGGCCGTTPPTSPPSSSGARTPPGPSPAGVRAGCLVHLHRRRFKQDTSFLVVGERTNANGSKRFREAMLEGDWDTTVGMARDQIKEGSHVIDVCVDYTGADGVGDMTEVASRFATQSSAPLMVDTTEGPWPKPPSSGSAVGPS